MKSWARTLIPPLLGAVLVAASGCGGPPPVAVDPEGGEKVKQARIKAYGPSGTPSGKGESVNAQAAARQK